MGRRKRRKQSDTALAMLEVKRIGERLLDETVNITTEECDKVLKSFEKYQSNFFGHKNRMFIYLACVMKRYFILTSCYASGNVHKKVDSSYSDWRIVDFLRNSLFKKLFPLVNLSFVKPLTEDTELFLKAIQKVFSDFEVNSGGRSRKILLSLLVKHGARASYLAKLAGVSTRWVRKCKTMVSDNEVKGFYKRFDLTSKKQYYSKEEMKVVLDSFMQSCPGDSYTKSDKNMRQMCGDHELYTRYISYVQSHNILQKEKDPNYIEIPTRCYNVFLNWKMQFKVRRTIQRDVDYNCNYCYEYWELSNCIGKLEKDIFLQTKTIEKLLLGMLLFSLFVIVIFSSF